MTRVTNTAIGRGYDGDSAGIRVVIADNDTEEY